AGALVPQGRSGRHHRRRRKESIVRHRLRRTRRDRVHALITSSKQHVRRSNVRANLQRCILAPLVILSTTFLSSRSAIPTTFAFSGANSAKTERFAAS